jgi:hypothetical protein
MQNMLCASMSAFARIVLAILLALSSHYQSVHAFGGYSPIETRRSRWFSPYRGLARNKRQSSQTWLAQPISRLSMDEKVLFIPISIKKLVTREDKICKSLDLGWVVYSSRHRRPSCMLEKASDRVFLSNMPEATHHNFDAISKSAWCNLPQLVQYKQHFVNLLSCYCAFSLQSWSTMSLHQEETLYADNGSRLQSVERYSWNQHHKLNFLKSML